MNSIQVSMLFTALLGSNDFATRQIASRNLKEFGPLALPALGAVLDSDDYEVKHRATELYNPIKLQIDLERQKWRTIHITNAIAESKDMPYIDSMPVSYPDHDILLNKYRQEAEAYGVAPRGNDNQDWARDRYASLLFLRDKVSSDPLFWTTWIKMVCRTCYFNKYNMYPPG